METTETVDLAALSLDDLEAELATLASHLYAGTCRWLELVGELDRRGGFTEDGQASAPRRSSSGPSGPPGASRPPRPESCRSRRT